MTVWDERKEPLLKGKQLKNILRNTRKALGEMEEQDQVGKWGGKAVWL